MPEKRKRSAYKKLLRLGITLAIVFIVAVVGLHIWFVNNARSVLKQIVAEKSHGKLKLELSQLSFNFFSNKLQIRTADLASIDTTQSMSYHISFRKLTVRVHSFWPLVLQKKLLLDSIKLHDPDIEVTQWRKDSAVKTTRNDLTVPQQMGKLYNSMLDALESFGIRRITIDNARLSLINKINPGIDPVVISHIYFDLLRSGRPSGRRDMFVQNEQSVALRTSNQNIKLPSGRHLLAFKDFSLELFGRRMELDSCTVTALPTGITKSSYTLFFKKLLLIGVDFDAMYRYNLIRADSVYCENPNFNFKLKKFAAGRATASKQKPDLEEVIRDLSGDLDLAFIGVKNAGIQINISGSKERSIFNSNRDNFEMYGLRINADSSEPVLVRRFDMLVRDYHLYNEDSSTAYSFDSIHFRDNKVVLNNFSVLTEPTRFKQRNERNFRIPYFELTGLDWYDLVFNQNLTAQEAVLYDPVIRFKKNIRSRIQRRSSIFGALQTLDSLMSLDKIKIINGQLNMNLGPATSIVLQDLNMSLNSDFLMKSTNREGLRRAIDLLSFSKGIIRIKDIRAELQNIRYTGTNLIHGDQLRLSSTTNRIRALVNDVYIDNLLLDDETSTVLLDGLRWKNASVALRLLSQKEKTKTGNIRLKNISGRDTKLELSGGKINVSTVLTQIKLASLVRNRRSPLQMQGLLLAGSRLDINGAGMVMKAGSYSIGSGDSYLEQLDFRQVRSGDSLHVQSPRLEFSADINALLEKDVHLNQLRAERPVIRIKKMTPPSTVSKSKQNPIRIDQFLATEPDIHITTVRNDSATTVLIPRSDKGRISASGIRLQEGEMQLGSLSLNTDKAFVEQATGQKVGVEQGKLNVDLADITIGKKEGKLQWNGLINRLELVNPNSFTLGKGGNKLHLNQAMLGNLQLSSAFFSDPKRIIHSNLTAWLRTGTGEYSDSNTTIKWFNAEYNHTRNLFRMDSFSYHPTQPRDTVVARSKYQTDYISFESGPVELRDFNMEKYQKDSSLIINEGEVSRPVITVYRDKKPPFLSGVVKPLPVDMIGKIPFPVLVNKINITEGTLYYTERHAKTRAEGTLLLAHMQAELSDIKNRNISQGDSLSLSLNSYLMDSAYLQLRVKESYTDSLNGFLMNLKMRPTSLSFLNPVLAPMSNVKITSGSIDSFQLRAVALEDFAYGEMNMFYHNLKIKLVKHGDENLSSFFGNVLSFLANAVVVRKNNNGRKGIVYFERMRDRSFFNYIVKIAFSGMSTSIGVKKNKKFLRKYRQKLREEHLPEINLE